MLKLEQSTNLDIEYKHMCHPRTEGILVKKLAKNNLTVGIVMKLVITYRSRHYQDMPSSFSVFSGSSWIAFNYYGPNHIGVVFIAGASVFS